VQFHLVSSTNHASPTGALPFLLPPTNTNTSPTPNSPVTPIPSTSLRKYALSNGGRNPVPDDAPHLRQQQAYQALLDGPIRAAWLHALYLTPANAPLLASLYAQPSTASAPVRAALLRQLRLAASAEVALSSPSSSSSPTALYAEAADAFAALATLLQRDGGPAAGRWFFGRETPGEFDAAVFAYTQLLLGGEDEGGLRWGDPALAELARGAGEGELVRHRGRIWDMFWREAEVGEGNGEE
jgi:metaxin